MKTEEKAVACIEHFEKFFHSLGIQTKLSEYTTDYLGTAERIEARFIERGMLGLGEHKAITPSDVRQIVSMSY
jgi:NADP-dependent alcohol dehydrogenase